MDIFKNIDFTFEFFFVVFLPLIVAVFHTVQNLGLLKWGKVKAEVLNIEFRLANFGQGGEGGYSEFIKLKYNIDEEEYIKEVPYRLGSVYLQLPYKRSVESGFEIGQKISIYVNPKDKSDIIFKIIIFDLFSFLLLLLSLLMFLFFKE